MEKGKVRQDLLDHFYKNIAYELLLLKIESVDHPA